VRRSKAPSVILGAAGGMLVLSGALTVAYVLDIRQAGAASVVPSDRVDQAGEVAHGDLRSKVSEAAEAFLDRQVEVQFAERSEVMTWRELGLAVDDEAVATEIERLATGGAIASLAYDGPPAGGEVPVTVERERTMAALFALKERLDNAPVSARLDLEGRQVHASKAGWGIDVYSSMSALELAARTAEPAVALEGTELRPARTIEDLGIDDISEVMGTFSTPYRIDQTTRNSNLKLAASQINGHVLQPGDTFSFNTVVGRRSKEVGYMIAPVISEGQFVDGTAGGICQISSTLHGAAFFAGLDIVRALPHSRPIGYIPMALDATVVYPYVDVVFRNGYDFPVAIHFKVADGETVVEILGQGRPYDKIQFVREIMEELPFQSVTREDDTMPVGSMVVDQHGFLGYKVRRTRNFIKDGRVVKRDRWNLEYRPVTEYARVGINPDPNLSVPRQQPNRNTNPPRQRQQVLEQ
jgi:vancomycin resistance protein YoaR